MVRAKIEYDLNFSSLADAVALETGQTKEAARETVQAVLDITGRALASGHRVKLPNAFTLEPSRRRVAKGALGGRIERAMTVRTVRFHLNGKLHDAVRSGRKVTTLRKTGKSA